MFQRAGKEDWWWRCLASSARGRWFSYVKGGRRSIAFRQVMSLPIVDVLFHLTTSKRITRHFLPRPALRMTRFPGWNSFQNMSIWSTIFETSDVLFLDCSLCYCLLEHGLAHTLLYDIFLWSTVFYMELAHLGFILVLLRFWFSHIRHLGWQQSPFCEEPYPRDGRAGGVVSSS